MAKQTKPDPDVTKTLQNIALRYPEAQHGIACQGTAVECSSFKARDKAFLFVGGTGPSYTVRLKLRELQAEATKLAAKEPARYNIGAHGWAKVTFSVQDPPPPDLMERWIDESYRAVADKKLVAQLPDHPAATAKRSQRPAELNLALLKPVNRTGTALCFSTEKLKSVPPEARTTTRLPERPR